MFSFDLTHVNALKKVKHTTFNIPYNYTYPPSVTGSGIFMAYMLPLYHQRLLIAAVTFFKWHFMLVKGTMLTDYFSPSRYSSRSASISPTTCPRGKRFATQQHVGATNKEAVVLQNGHLLKQDLD